MAMRTASPWWASLVFGVGLLFMFVGERLFGHLPGVAHGVHRRSGLVARARRHRAARVHDDAPRPARAATSSARCSFCQLGVVLALVLYAFTTKWGMGHFHFSEKGAAKFETALTVLWAIVIVVVARSRCS